MVDGLVIRDETAADVAGIEAVTVAAFAAMPISNQTEHFVVAALRAAGALSISLVATLDGRIVGHLALSPVTISDGAAGWYGLGPVSVAPELQRRGVGSALMAAGLARLRALGGRGCCLVGWPDYYRRFGFAPVPGLVHEGVPPEVFMALLLAGDWPRGTVEFHAAFKAEGPAGADQKRIRA